MPGAEGGPLPPFPDHDGLVLAGARQPLAVVGDGGEPDLVLVVLQATHAVRGQRGRRVAVILQEARHGGPRWQLEFLRGRRHHYLIMPM